MVDYNMTPGTYPDSSKIIKTDNYRYVAEDGWSIECLDQKKYVFSFIDPGHSGRLIRIEILKEDDDFARINNPSFNEFLARLNVLGRVKEID